MADYKRTPGRQGRPITDRDAGEISRVEELSYDLKVFETMTWDVVSTTREAKVSEAMELLRTRHISGLPVLKNEELAGVISIEDVVRAMEKNELSAPVSQYMTTDIISVRAYEPVIKAIEKFSLARVGRLPVLDENDKLVGIITKGDVTRGILVALQEDYKVEDVRRYRASHLFEDITSDRTSLILRYHIKARDYENGGQASSHIKRALLRLGASPQLARQCGIAVYEAEMNLIIHTDNGGTIRIQIEPHRILMQTTDTGPGIADVNQAMQAGWSTASQEARDMGFGAGMGLVNISRCVNRMEIESAPGKGTKLWMEILLSPEERFGGSAETAPTSEPDGEKK